ncbi:hypothetical protein DNTS_027536 [Danionella cerebrum]|uniref:Uncharacterized protein n=1 Tax=Danionella cerebrum TaxID=2873325 RepID=A0A553R2R2_9TELE|nr:hypothetical protein DNTS_027536 [Danionella translucida]
MQGLVEMDQVLAHEQKGGPNANMLTNPRRQLDTACYVALVLDGSCGVMGALNNVQLFPTPGHIANQIPLKGNRAEIDWMRSQALRGQRLVENQFTQPGQAKGKHHKVILADEESVFCDEHKALFLIVPMVNPIRACSMWVGLCPISLVVSGFRGQSCGDHVMLDPLEYYTVAPFGGASPGSPSVPDMMWMTFEQPASCVQLIAISGGQSHGEENPSQQQRLNEEHNSTQISACRTKISISATSLSFSLMPFCTQQRDFQTRKKVSGGLGGEGLDAGGVAIFAENMAIQRVATLAVSLREKTTTVLCRHINVDFTQSAVLFLLVEVLDAVDVVGSVHSEGNAIQTAMADHAERIKINAALLIFVDFCHFSRILLM